MDCTFIRNNLVSWHNKKLIMIVRSRVEVVYRAMAHIVFEMIWIQSLMRRMYCFFSIYGDVLLQSGNNIFCQQSCVSCENKTHCHFIQDIVLAKWIIFHVSSTQIGDVFRGRMSTKSFYFFIISWTWLIFIYKLKGLLKKV